MFTRHCSLLCIFLGLLLTSGCEPSYPVDQAGVPEVVDFNFHVKPILSDRCYACHGPDANKRKANLRLDQPESAVRTRLESGKYALVPGSLRKSQVFHRITSLDPEERMPPAEANLSLSEKEIAILVKWIQQGAAYKPHWSLLPVSAQDPPITGEQAWVRNPIDQFIAAKLEEQGWTHNPEANKETLLRRVTLDLTGLPPTLEEIDAFLADDGEQAYEKVVDRLLKTNAYAERMTMEWLDVARYADSHGYSQDGYRFMWPWRNWVIGAFKENMPFDQFVTWQLAGDLLPNATQDQRLATAFLRNQRINSEGGIVPAEYLVEYAVERTATVGTAFMGLTMACARCHDHKYDPISQKDFYQFYAFFNNVNEAGLVQKDGNSGPQVLLMDEEVREKINALDRRIMKQKEQLQKLSNQGELQDLKPVKVNHDALLAAYLSFDKKTRSQRIEVKKDDEEPDTTNLVDDLVFPALEHKHVGEPTYEAGKHGQSLKFTAYDGVVLDGTVADFDRTDPFSFEFDVKPHPEINQLVLLFKHANKNNGYRGYSLKLDNGRPTFQMISAYPANLIQVRAEDALRPQIWSRFAITYDGSAEASGIRMYINGKAVDTSILFDQLTQSIRHSDPPDLRIGGKMQEQVEIDGGYALLDNFRVYTREISALEARMCYEEETDPSLYDISLQHAHYLSQQDGVHKRERRQLQNLLREKHAISDSLPGVMVMDDLPIPRPAYLLNRGQYDAPGEQVFPNTPAIILPFSADFEKNRLGVAKWLLHKDHPLTSRVTVNRYWHKYFGKGLVETTGDFGSQGALPSHPALLDWLATAFRDNNWDVQAFQKLIVMSATYRQSSFTPPAQRKADPGNKWYARGPSHRLSAEVLRDQALAASGLLVEKIGGPSVKPYQPVGLWSEKSFFSEVLKTYKPDTGQDLYRRSMYTFWRRTAPPPSMILFDAPTRDNCTVRRQRTNTPLQALVLLNDPQFVEAARVLAARVMQIQPEDRARQVATAFRLLSGLAPEAEVLQLLIDLYEKEEAVFSTEPAEAKELIAIGEAPLAIGLNLSQHAAMTVVVNTIMSFDEVVMKR